MDVRDLSREQLIELKEHYMIELADEGIYAEIMGVDWDEPSMGEIANADELIPDDVIFNHYEGFTFSDEDFFCTAA